jgi:hypothetical protein
VVATTVSRFPLFVSLIFSLKPLQNGDNTDPGGSELSLIIQVKVASRREVAPI